jgi:hypothetical protein
MFTAEFNIELNRRSSNGELEECLRMLENAKEYIDPRKNPSKNEVSRSILSHRAFVYYENGRWHEAAEEYGKLCAVVSIHDPFVTWFHSMWAQTTFRDDRVEEARRIFRNTISMWISRAKGPAEGLDLFFEYRKFKGELNESIEEDYRVNIRQIARYFGEDVNAAQDLFDVIDVLWQIKRRDSRAYGDLIIRHHEDIGKEGKVKLERDVREFLQNVRTPYLREQATNLLRELNG